MVGFAKELAQRFRRHNLSLVAAGTAFYGFLALVPALIAFVSIYGLVADPDDVRRQVHDVAGALPDEVERFLEFQLRSISEAGSTQVSVTLVIALLIALWSASGGVAALVTGIQVAHERSAEERPTFVQKRARALAMTVGGMLLVGLVFAVAAFLPSLLDDVVGESSKIVVESARWPVVLLVMIGGIGLLYRFADPRARHGWLGFVSRGAVVGALLWLAASLLFSFYAASFASYSKTYGSLAAIIVVLLWLFLSSFAVLVGAEIDAMCPPAAARTHLAPA